VSLIQPVVTGFAVGGVEDADPDQRSDGPKGATSHRS